MKNALKWILAVVLFAALIAGASVLYQKLSKDYSGENLLQMPADTTDTDETDDSAGETEKTAFAAPDFTVHDAEGNEVRLSDFAGKPIVLNFWATWCYYCKVEMPDFNVAHEKYPDVQFVMVNATDGVRETMADAKAYVAAEGYGFDVFYDTNFDAVSAYYVTGFPATYFIDKDGNLVTRANGMIDLATLEYAIGLIRE